MISVKITVSEIVDSEMRLTVTTTNTNYSGVTLSFSTLHSCLETVAGIQTVINHAAEMLWVAYAKPQWDVPS